MIKVFVEQPLALPGSANKCVGAVTETDVELARVSGTLWDLLAHSAGLMVHLCPTSPAKWMEGGFSARNRHRLSMFQQQ